MLPLFSRAIFKIFSAGWLPICRAVCGVEFSAYSSINCAAFCFGSRAICMPFKGCPERTYMRVLNMGMAYSISSFSSCSINTFVVYQFIRGWGCGHRWDG